jgi:mRNA-degrading endonuclease RelE of RelBE toxin-antitoxin system
MVTQVTISPRFQQKMDKLQELYGNKIEEKLVNLGRYAVEISPVDTGAFVESWSLRPIGSGGGRSRTSRNKPSKDPVAAKEDAKRLIEGDAVTYREQIIDRGGAVLTNRAPHAKEVEMKYHTVGRVKDRFR